MLLSVRNSYRLYRPSGFRRRHRGELEVTPKDGLERLLDKSFLLRRRQLLILRAGRQVDQDGQAACVRGGERLLQPPAGVPQQAPDDTGCDVRGLSIGGQGQVCGCSVIASRRTT